MPKPLRPKRSRRRRPGQAARPQPKPALATIGAGPARAGPVDLAALDDAIARAVAKAVAKTVEPALELSTDEVDVVALAVEVVEAEPDFVEADAIAVESIEHQPDVTAEPVVVAEPEPEPVVLDLRDSVVAPPPGPSPEELARDPERARRRQELVRLEREAASRLGALAERRRALDADEVAAV